MAVAEERRQRLAAFLAANEFCDLFSLKTPVTRENGPVLVISPVPSWKHYTVGAGLCAYSCREFCAALA